MNKQGPDKIDWTDYTWNPIRGKCEHNCHYCYMHNLWNRFPEMAKNQLVKKSLIEPSRIKKPSFIFTGSSTDMWGDWVPERWIQRVLTHVKECEQHTFQFLTKNPVSYFEFDLPKNGWYGTTIDGTPETKLNNMWFSEIRAHKTFISFEPLLKPIKVINDWGAVDWIIIGADSRNGAKRPPKEWADDLIYEAHKRGIPVWVKDNYGYPERIKERP